MLRKSGFENWVPQRKPVANIIIFPWVYPCISCIQMHPYVTFLSIFPFLLGGELPTNRKWLSSPQLYMSIHWGYNPLTKRCRRAFHKHSKGRPRLSWYRPGATRFWRLFFVDVLRRFCWWELNIYHKLWCIFVKGGIFYDRMTGFFKTSWKAMY